MNNILVNTYNKLTESYSEHSYDIPLDRDLGEAISEAKLHHPSWTSMQIIIVNPDGADRQV